ncbi:hypothetical protein [uncultured Roseobacter sp.]|uniref:hypothetical protein n=1 Tax=uncultured Roseobacter sp. TaxID=114847 RepID=UPI002619BBE9|nr:hypothetical protein [uncultured Roseobacter sp.]
MTLRASEGDKTVYLKIGVFYKPDTGHIHIAHGGEEGFITTVSPDPASKRGNPNLYRHLADCLRAKGMPAPDKE